MEESKDAYQDFNWKDLSEKLPWYNTPEDEAKREILWN